MYLFNVYMYLIQSSWSVVWTKPRNLLTSLPFYDPWTSKSDPPAQRGRDPKPNPLWRKQGERNTIYSSNPTSSLSLIAKGTPWAGYLNWAAEQKAVLLLESPGLRQGGNWSNLFPPSTITSCFVDKRLIIRARQVGTFQLLVVSSAILKRLQKLQIESLVPAGF